MDYWRIALAGLTVLGFVLTAWGLVAAYRDSRRALDCARVRAERARDLGVQEGEEQKALEARVPRERLEVEGERLIQKYVRLHEENGFPRPPGYGESSQPGREAVYVLDVLFDSARGDLVLAGVGLFVSTVASVLSLLMI